jgi:hypothetical protein
MLSPYNTTKKSAYARFFGPYYQYFGLFKMSKNPKKSEKCLKNRIFPYALLRFYKNIRITRKANIFANNTLK